MKETPYKRGFVLTCPRCSTQTDNAFIGVCKNCRKGKILASENEMFGCAYCGVICSSPRLYKCRKCGAVMDSPTIKLTGPSELGEGCLVILFGLGVTVGGVYLFGAKGLGVGLIAYVVAAVILALWREVRKVYVAPKKDRK